MNDSKSQIIQDVFVLNFFEKKKGFFLDLGCGDGVSHPCGNNTFLLEKFGWDGLSIDYNEDLIKNFQSNRKTKAICKDLTKFSIEQILKESGCPKIIDYLSFDVDEATPHVLKHLPTNEYKFKFITFEHNLYLKNQIQYKNLKQDAIDKFGNEYEILIENVNLINHGPVEDWYVHKDLTKNQKKIYLKDILCQEVLNKYEIRN